MPDYVYYNDIPEKEYADISIVFGSELMWVTVDDICCYVTDKMSYIEIFRENSLSAIFANGLDISVCVGTHTKAAIKSFVVTEYENDEPDIPAEIADLPELSPFELYVKGLSAELQDAMFKTDEFFMQDMKNSLKFRRSIDKCGHLVYKSTCGFHYEIREFGVHNWHRANWRKKPENTDMILAMIAETSPGLADRLFAGLQECNPHARECSARTTVKYKGMTKSTCGSYMSFEWQE